MIHSLISASLGRSDRLSRLFSTPGLAVHGAGGLLAVFPVAWVLTGGDPGVPITSYGLVLLGQVETLAVLLAGSLGQRAGSRRQAGLNGRLGLDPVGEGLFAVLDDGFASLIAVISLASLARSYGGVVNEVQEMLAVSGDDSDLFAVFAKRIELVLEGCLELLSGDVGELRLSN